MNARKDDDHEEFRRLSIELVKTQAWAMEEGRKAVILFEGRDAAGKDGAIRHIARRLSPRATRIVALPKPSSREESEWWFQRYVAHLPSAGEWVIFNRSWYNRAGVERVMGFARSSQQEQFLLDVPDIVFPFEAEALKDGRLER